MRAREDTRASGTEGAGRGGAGQPRFPTGGDPAARETQVRPSGTARGAAGQGHPRIPLAGGMWSRAVGIGDAG